MCAGCTHVVRCATAIAIVCKVAILAVFGRRVALVGAVQWAVAVHRAVIGATVVLAAAAVAIFAKVAE
jgi:hypothetical protein